MRELALFAGAGGGILGGKLLGWRTVCAVEINSYRARRLLQRQTEGHFSPFPVWDDVCSFNGFPWRGFVDVVSGGFPCQDISVAGKGAGIDGEFSGLWHEMFRIICEVRPRFVFVENSPMLTRRGLDRVLGDLASVDFDAECGVLSAEEAGAPQIRERIWIVAHSTKIDGESGMGFRQGAEPIQRTREESRTYSKRWMESVRRNAGSGNGMAYRVDRTEAIGDGQVPAVVRLAWNILNNIRKSE
ncbi:DNA cytosine methyltransferase [Leptospira adleri]|uniref:DNA (cytosine-5-)-methyltransferase n=1 Tax=Leptospira adleri TaxID=2023186 RepID=A0A2M9YJ82_9LEPT|nr:DNA cytosine methyltransferase [Leptospira adleri]PJZ61894.1 DNA cytosine methyltransferase [Leptospira adleri]